MAAPGPGTGPEAGGGIHRHQGRDPGPLRLHGRRRLQRRRPHPPPHPALPPAYAARLFDAKAAGARDDDLQAVIAEGLQNQYFQDGGRRATGLHVQFTDIDYLDIQL